MTWLTKKTINKFKNFKNEIADSRKPKRNINLSKKLVFTALAVVAFSGAAMAKTGEDKTIKVVAEDCQTKAMNYIDNVYDPNGTKSPAQVNAAYQGYLQGCEDSKTKSISAN